MVRTYRRKTDRGVKGSLDKALELVANGYTLRKAATEAGVNHVTLSRRVKSNESGTGYKKPRFVFDQQME